MTTIQNIRLFSYHKLSAYFVKEYVDKVDNLVHKSIFRLNGVVLHVDNLVYAHI